MVKRVSGSFRISAETPFGEGAPDEAAVLATCKGFVGIEDGVAGSDECWAAGLEFHAVDDELHSQETTIGGNTVDECWLAGICDAVLVDEVPHHLVEHRGPDGANEVDEGRVVGGGVDHGISGHASGVEVRPDAGGTGAHPVAHRVAGLSGVGCLHVDGNGHEISPTLAHTTGLGSG